MSTETLGTRLRHLRQAADLTLEELASRSGVSFSTVCRIEAGGDARVSTIEALAQALGVRASQLLEVSNPRRS